MKQIADAHEFRGQHIYADIYDLDADEVGDWIRLRTTLAEAIEVCGANICGHVDKTFEPQGFTCLYLLAESHASIHTYPEQGAIFFDAFTCGRLDPGLDPRPFRQPVPQRPGGGGPAGTGRHGRSGARAARALARARGSARRPRRPCPDVRPFVRPARPQEHEFGETRGIPGRLDRAALPEYALGCRAPRRGLGNLSRPHVRSRPHANAIEHQERWRAASTVHLGGTPPMDRRAGAGRRGAGVRAGGDEVQRLARGRGHQGARGDAARPPEQARQARPRSRRRPTTSRSPCRCPTRRWPIRPARSASSTATSPC